MGKIIFFISETVVIAYITLHMHYPHRAGIVNMSKTLLQKYLNYFILISPIGHQTVSKQIKLDLVIVQIKTIKVYFQISFSIF